MSDIFPMTKRGYESLQKELKVLKYTERPAIIKAIAEARDLGDLSENAEYHAAREKQAFLEGRITDLENILGQADVVDTSQFSGDIVRFGAVVTLMDGETEEKSTYQIVGEYEADIEKGSISITSPLARAMIGRKRGESITVETPKGVVDYEISDVVPESVAR